MTTTLHAAAALLPRALSTAQSQALAEVPPETAWFNNLTNTNTRWAYRQDIEDFMAFAGLSHAEQFRAVTRAHVIAWRQHLVGQELVNDTIRRKLAALWRCPPPSPAAGGRGRGGAPWRRAPAAWREACARRGGSGGADACADTAG
jgi:hypothetical protein